MGLFRREPKPKARPVPTGAPPVARLSLENIKQLNRELPRASLVHLREDFKIARSGPPPTSIASTRSLEQQEERPSSRSISRSRSQSSFGSTPPQWERQHPMETSSYPHVPQNAMSVDTVVTGHDGISLEERIIAANERRIARHAEEVAQGIFEGPPQTYKPWRTEKKVPEHLASQSKKVNTGMGGWRGVGGAVRASEAPDTPDRSKHSSSHGSRDADVQPVKQESWQPTAPEVSMLPRDLLRGAAAEYTEGLPDDPAVSMRPENVMMRSHSVRKRMATSQSGASSDVSRQDTSIKVPRAHNLPKQEMVTVHPPASQPRKKVDRPERMNILPQEPFESKARQRDARCDEGYHETIKEPIPQKSDQQRMLLTADNVMKEGERQHGLRVNPLAEKTPSSSRQQTGGAPISFSRPSECLSEPTKKGPHLPRTAPGDQEIVADNLVQSSSRSDQIRANPRLTDTVPSEKHLTVDLSFQGPPPTGQEHSKPRLRTNPAKRTPVLVSNHSHNLARAQYAEWVDESARVRPSFPCPLENEHPDSRIQQWLQRIELRSLDGQPEEVSGLENLSQKCPGTENEARSCLSASALYVRSLSSVAEPDTAEKMVQTPGAVNNISRDAPDPTKYSVPAACFQNRMTRVVDTARLLPQLPRLFTDEDALAMFDFRKPACMDIGSKASPSLPSFHLDSAPQATMSPTSQASDKTDSKKDEYLDAVQRKSCSSSPASFCMAPEWPASPSLHAAEPSRPPSANEEDLVPATSPLSPSPNVKKVTTPSKSSQSPHPEDNNIQPVLEMSRAPSSIVVNVVTQPDVMGRSTSIRSSSAIGTIENDSNKSSCADWSLVLQNRLSVEKPSSLDKDSGSDMGRESLKCSALATPNENQIREATAENDEECCSTEDDDVESVPSVAESYLKGKDEVSPPIPFRSSARPRSYPAIGINAHQMKVHQYEDLKPEGNGMPPVGHSSQKTWSYPHRPNLVMRPGFVTPGRAEEKTERKIAQKTGELDGPNEDLIKSSNRIRAKAERDDEPRELWHKHRQSIVQTRPSSAVSSSGLHRLR